MICPSGTDHVDVAVRTNQQMPSQPNDVPRRRSLQLLNNPTYPFTTPEASFRLESSFCMIHSTGQWHCVGSLQLQPKRFRWWDFDFPIFPFCHFGEGAMMAARWIHPRLAYTAILLVVLSCFVFQIRASDVVLSSNLASMTLRICSFELSSSYMDLIWHSLCFMF